MVSACRAFGLDCGFEPAGHVSAEGNVARIYNATASGGIHLFCYKGNILQNSASLAAFRRYAPLLTRAHSAGRRRIVSAQDFLDPRRRLPIAGVRGRPRSPRPPGLRNARPDHASTPLAARIKVLAIPDAPYAETAEIENLRRWVAGGGILVAAASSERPLLRTPEGDDAPCRTLLADVPDDAHLFGPRSRARRRGDSASSSARAHDEHYLWGQWHAVEHGSMFPEKLLLTPECVGRGPGPASSFPAIAAADATLLLTVNLTPRSLPGANRVLVGGVEVGRIEASGVRTYRFAVPRRLLASRPIAEVAIEVRAFRPRDFGNPDNRELGVAVAAVELCGHGAEHDPLSAAPLAWEIDSAQAARCVRRIGRGATLAMACRNPREFSEAVVQALAHPDRLSGSAAAPSRTVITAGDGLYATRLSDGILYYNAGPKSQTIDGVEVPADGIAWRAGGN